MRPTADILADIASSLDEWDLTSSSERTDALTMRPWLEICLQHRAREPLCIPPSIETDPRFDSVERFVLAAMGELDRDVDMTRSEAFEAVCVRLFGSCHDCVDRWHARAAVDRLVSRGVLCRTVSGGFIRRMS